MYRIELLEASVGAIAEKTTRFHGKQPLQIKLEVS